MPRTTAVQGCVDVWSSLNLWLFTCSHGVSHVVFLMVLAMIVYGCYGVHGL